MYEETVSISKEYGYSHYEVSSYAKTPSAISRHNFSYWQGMDYLGILWLKVKQVEAYFTDLFFSGVGPGAHGRLTDFEENKRVRTFGVNNYNELVIF
jgi:oxygen-independent coproporphyrinogen-3 oxidase